MALSATSVSFGSIAVAYTTAPRARTLTITNNQSVPINLSIPIGGSNPGDFAIAAGSTCGSSLAAKVKCTILLTFTPAAVGVRSATLAVTDGPDAYGPHSVLLTGTGLVPVAFSSSSLSFGKITVGLTSSVITRGVTNNQPVPTSLNALLSGTNPGDFTLTAASTCGSSLAANSKCSYSITFTPTAKGARAATLVISGNPDLNSPHQVALLGTGG